MLTTSFQQLLAALPSVGSAPCAGCEHASKCAPEHLACREFSDYVMYGSVIPADVLAARRKRGELGGAREPTRERYDLIYTGDDDHESES